MHRIVGIGMALLMGLAGPARADRAGDFDYYVLSLGWSSTWCSLTGDARGDPQCDPGKGRGFVLHGLWPQHETGWPEYCATTTPDASRSQTAAMADIMGGAGLAWHEWKKHGRCSGLSAGDYFALSRTAYGAVTVPEGLAQADRDLTLPALEIKAAFLEANPWLAPAEIVVTCDHAMIAEVRICLTRNLDPRPCGSDVARDCRLSRARLPARR